MKSLTKLCLLALAMFFVSTTALAAAPVKQTGEPAGTKQPESVEERRLLVEIAQKKQMLRQREQALRQRELELDSLQRELDKKLEQIASRRSALEEMLKQKDAIEQERIAELAKMYEKMDKAKVARLMEKMDWPLAREILAQIKTKTRGKIIAEMSPSSAIRFTRDYSSLERN